MRYVTVLSLLALGAAGAACAGDIYCNNQGKDCSDRPTPGAQFKGSTYSQATASNAPATAPTSTGNTPTPSTDAAANARLSQDASKAAVQKDVAASRAEQCKAAKDKYQQSIEARRLYRVNKAGEREYLSDNEFDQARLNARLEMDRACGNPAT